MKKSIGTELKSELNKKKQQQKCSWWWVKCTWKYIIRESHTLAIYVHQNSHKRSDCHDDVDDNDDDGRRLCFCLKCGINFIDTRLCAEKKWIEQKVTIEKQPHTHMHRIKNAKQKHSIKVIDVLRICFGNITKL